MTESIQKQNLTLEGRAFNSKLTVNTLDLIQNRSSQNRDKVESWLDPEKMPVNIGFCGNTSEIEARQLGNEGSSLSSDILTVSQAADLLIVHPATIRKACRNGKFKNVQKQSIDGGEGWLIPITSLPASAQTKHYKAQKQAIQQAATAALAKAGISSPAPVTENERHEEFQRMQEWYDRKPANFKTRVEKNLTVLRAYLAYRDQGMTVGEAELALKNSHGVNRSTIRRYLSATKNYPVYVWAAALCSKHKGGRERAEFTETAWLHILNNYISTPHAKLSVLYRDANKVGAALGWVIPSLDTVAKRIKEQPANLFLSNKQLERSFPTITREYSMPVNEVWDTDGRRADIFVVWWDGEIVRPFVIMYRDVRSRYVVGVRICKNPDAESAAGAFGVALKHTLAVPKYLKADNGREYENKLLSAGQDEHYRRQSLAKVSDGLFKEMGIEVRFSKPGEPRDKSIESFWNAMSQNVDRAPIFTDAYCGHHVLAKPEGFNKKNAAPVQLFFAAMRDAVNEFHQRTHSGNGMFGRTPYEVFNDQTLRAASRKPTESEIRKCRWGKAHLSINKAQFSFKFKPKGSPYEVTFSAPELLNLTNIQKQSKFDVYYDFHAEPESPVSVWQGGAFICEAQATMVLDFIGADTSEIAKNAKAKGDYMKSVKDYKKKLQKLALHLIEGEIKNFYYHNEITHTPTDDTGFELQASAKPKALAAPVSAVRQVEGEPFMEEHVATGQRLTRVDKVRLADSQATVEDAGAATKKKRELEELERRRKALEEERLADLRKAG